MLSLFYDRDFFLARIIVYIVAGIFLSLAFSGLVHFSCDDSGIICPACGLRTAFIDALELDYAAAIEANGAVVFLLGEIVFGIVDCIGKIVFCSFKKRSLEHAWQKTKTHPLV